MAELTDKHREMLGGTNFGVVATVGADGRPQTSVVWVDTDGDHVVFNTTNGRAKGKNLRRDPRVSVTVFDAQNPYRYFEVEGTAVLETEGADEHIDALSRKYNGSDFTGPRDRVIVKVVPERIFDYQV
jgi:PPOX class probable F420-dependent enzyme